MRTDDLSPSFQTPEFLEILAKYEEMVRQHRTLYFESNDLILLAEYYAGKQKINEANEVIHYALSIHPDNLELRIYECNTLIANGKLEEAEQKLNQIPDQLDEEVIYTRTTLYLERNQPEKTDELLIPLVESEDYDPDMLIDIVNLFLDANNETYARKWLDMLFEYADEGQQPVLETAADFYLTFSHYTQAIDTYNQLLDIDPYQIDYWLNLTRAYLATEQTEQAFNAIDFALTVEENHPKALELKGYCYLQSNNSEEAIRCFEQVLPETEIPINLYQVLEACYTSLGKLEQSIVYLNKLLADPMIPDFERAIYYQKLASHQLQLSQFEPCLENIHKGLEYDREYAPLYLTLGEYYLLSNDEHAAELEFAHAEAFATDRGELQEQILEAYFKAGYFQDTLQHFRQLEKHYPLLADKYYLCAAYCCYVLHDETDLMKYLVRANTFFQHQHGGGTDYLQPSGLIPEEEDFLRIAQEINQRLTDGSIRAEDYFDLPDQPCL